MTLLQGAKMAELFGESFLHFPRCRPPRLTLEFGVAYLAAPNSKGPALSCCTRPSGRRPLFRRVADFVPASQSKFRITMKPEAGRVKISGSGGVSQRGTIDKPLPLTAKIVENRMFLAEIHSQSLWQ
jgi:hypothetical protein